MNLLDEDTPIPHLSLTKRLHGVFDSLRRQRERHDIGSDLLVGCKFEQVADPMAGCD